MLAFTLVVSIAMALLFAWAPRLTFMNDPVRAMSGGGGRSTGGSGRRRAQRALVVSQLAASFMLLIGAGLLTRSLMRLYAVDPGFDLANVLSLQAPGLQRSRTATGRVQFSRDVLERVKAEATVQSAAMASAAPLAGSFPQQREFRIDGADADAIASGAEDRDPRREQRRTSKRSGRRMKVGPIVPGRPIRATSPPVVILSESMARYYFKDRQPDRPASQLEAVQRQLVADGQKSSASPRTRAPTGSTRRRCTRCISPTRRRARSRRCSSGPPARRTGSRRASSRRFAASIRTGRSITCRRSRRSATRRSRRSG